jgi:ferritin
VHVIAASQIFDYCSQMSAAEIIQEIKRLPREERQKVTEFARENLEDGQLSSQELGELTRQMVETKDQAEAAGLKEKIMQGFYGNAPHA